MSILVEPPSKQTQPIEPGKDRRRPTPKSRRWTWIWGGIGAASLLGIGFLLFVGIGKTKIPGENPPQAGQADKSDESPSQTSDDEDKAAVKVKVVHPHQGGITRTTTQLAEIRFFAHVQMFAKVAGFLRSQVVDIGDTVRKGDVLAEVYAPEYEQQVEQAAAAVEQARAEVAQAEAMITVDQAAVQAEIAIVKQREAQIGQYTATRKYREKEYIRYTELAVNKAIDERAADEKQDDFESAKSGEKVAVASVEAARGTLARTLAQVERAKADLKAARARVLVAEAREANARIFQRYTRLTAPFSGVVTERNFYDGDFVRDAAQGANNPSILGLARTDLMRVVVYIPDSQVAYLDRGDEAVVSVQALGGEEFRGKIDRYSNMEMASNRAMRAEVDLPNPGGRLRHGMYGDVTILLQPPTNVLTIPSPGLVDNDGHGAGSVFVARDRKARKVSIRVGNDNGLVSEVLSGLGIDDDVIVDYSGSIEDGSAVVPLPASAEDAKHGAKPGK